MNYHKDFFEKYDKQIITNRELNLNNNYKKHFVNSKEKFVLFDKAIKERLHKPEKVALQNAVIQFSKKHPIKLDKKMIINKLVMVFNLWVKYILMIKISQTNINKLVIKIR